MLRPYILSFSPGLRKCNTTAVDDKNKQLPITNDSVIVVLTSRGKPIAVKNRVKKRIIPPPPRETDHTRLSLA